MRAKSFVWSVFITLFVLGLLYGVVYIFQIQRKVHDVVSYKNFLLVHTKEFERIIIESGSNAHHGVDSSMFEEAFGKLTINISDTGSFPLRNKLYRIQANAKPGDVVLMPLEYLHYSYDALAKSYYDAVFNTIAFYFTPLPFDEKIAFLLQTPFSSLFRSLFYETTINDNSVTFTDMFNKGARGEHIFVTKGDVDYWSTNSSCEDYLFFTNRKVDFELSEVFLENVALMQQIEREKKIHFVLTYPSVAGDGCHEGVHREKFLEMIAKVKSVLQKHRIAFVGTFEASAFGAESMDNTYYHILPHAKEIRTKRLIEEIKHSDYAALFTSHTCYEIPKIQIAPLVGNSLHVLEANRNYLSGEEDAIVLIDGWYAHEQWGGVWSRGTKSRIALKVSEAMQKNGFVLELDGIVFGKKDRTKVFVNDKELGEYLLDGKTRIMIEAEYLHDAFVLIAFEHKNVISPLEAGHNKDTRKIKYALKSFSVLKFPQKQ
jgi:hypothetical protein